MKEVNTLSRCNPWRSAKAPSRILAMRFQAMGDLMITLPYLQSMKQSLPGVQLHLLTRHEVGDVPKNITLFDKVILLGGGRNAKLQFIIAILLLPYLWWQRYDIVLDLQNNRISRIVRFMLFASSWSEFDKSSKVSAAERTRAAIQAVNIGSIQLEHRIEARIQRDYWERLVHHGWNGRSSFIVLNPAGAFVTRNWSLDNYCSFAKLWCETVDPEACFVLLGLNHLAHPAAMLRSQLNEKFIDLTGKTTPFEAFMILRKAKLVLTEDSGLMHMAWIQGVPTLALFGSSPSYWSAPAGVWSRCLSSSDLPCGDCFSETCQFGDVHCLTRYTPEFVVKEGRSLLSKCELVS